MPITRRGTLRIAGLSVASTVFAGCLSVPTGTQTEPTDRPSNGSSPTGDTDIQRIDTPPYEITKPDCDPPDDERDPLWLCENMAAEPSLLFDQVETSGSVLQNEGLQPETDEKPDSQFYATLLTNSEDLDRIDQGQDSPAVKLIEETDFGSQAILIAQTGWGSGSITPHIKRVEDTDDGIHAYGCYRWPCVWTDDYTERTVVVRFEQPDSLTVGTVSLTIDAETRMNFRTDEGIVGTD